MKLRALRVMAFLMPLVVLAAWAAPSINTVRSEAPLIVNTATTANVESCYAFTSIATGFDMHSRGGNAIKVAFTVGASGTTYITVDAGTYWSPDRAFFKNAENVCFQTAANDTIELVVWR